MAIDNFILAQNPRIRNAATENNFKYYYIICIYHSGKVVSEVVIKAVEKFSAGDIMEKYNPVNE